MCNERGCECEGRYMCTHCGALLFRAESKSTAARGPFNTKYEGGNLCCAKGTVMLNPIMRHEAVEAVFADPTKRAYLIEFARQFNNALALASTKAKCPIGERPLPGNSTWNPSVILDGKLHHYFGTLFAADGQPAQYAQLYVLDPAGQSSETVKKRTALLHLPKGTSARKKDGCIDLLKELAQILRDCNPFVRDLITVGELMAADDTIPEKTFVIDSGKKGAGAAHSGVYSNNGTRRTFAEVKVLSDEQPETTTPLCCALETAVCLRLTRRIVLTIRSTLCCSCRAATAGGTGPCRALSRRGDRSRRSETCPPPVELGQPLLLLWLWMLEIQVMQKAIPRVTQS
jgi:hypothetical protein